MKLRARASAVVLTAVISATSCQKAQPAKFKPGDKVRTNQGAEGVIVARLRPFVDDGYFVRVAGPDPSDEWYQRHPEGAPRSHVIGPYDTADLRLVARAK